MGHFLVDVFFFFFFPASENRKSVIVFFGLGFIKFKLGKTLFRLNSSNLLFLSLFHRRPAADVTEVKGHPGLCVM